MSNAAMFAPVAREYASFRPGYPEELFAWLAGACVSRAIAWDCGCGSGQASVALAGHFERVHATDVSAEQIAAARAHDGVRYSVAAAECSGLDAASVDLVTVAQALHWFDVEGFYAEARRVARPGALLAVWTYPRPVFVEEGLDRAFRDFYSHEVGPYWPPERRHVETGYATLPFPFEEIPHPPFALELRWSIEQVVGYVSSWSATSRYRQTLGRDPVPLLQASLREVWPAAGGSAEVRMPLALRVARIRAPGPEGPVVRSAP